MKLVIEFDCNADIIDVPLSVVEKKEHLKKRFLQWIYNKKNKHKYWISGYDTNGKKYQYLRYRSDAFVEWLNSKVLKNGEQAIILEEYTSDYSDDLPVIFF